MIEEGTLSIGDLQNVIQILGEVYRDSRDALAEFITNASDANATKIYVFLHKRAKETYIRVSDNGDGMTYSDLKYVAENIGNSLKRYDLKTVGEKGIGILGFQKIAERCDIVSKGNSNKETFCLSLKAGTLKYSIRQEKERGLQIRGTDVYLYGISDDTWRLFTRDKLANHFKFKFRPDLSSGAYSLVIVEGKETTSVRPEAYKGEPFYMTSVRTNYGDIRLSLYIQPTGKPYSIGIYCKNKKVLNITDLPEFACEPWTLGKVQGEITADFLKPDTTRVGFIRDRKHFPAWVNAIKSIEKQLAAEIERLSKSYNAAQNRKLYKKLKLAFQKAIDELNIEWIKRRKTSKVLALTSSATRSKGGKSTGTKIEKRKKRRPRAFDFSWAEEDFSRNPDLNPEFRSHLDPKLRTIIANITHPDYRKECQSPDGRLAYFRILTSKELTLFTYSKASQEEIAEELIGTEVCVKRYL
jgi:1,2-phenylacetyl-CoA epoxidase PaaB subunit